MASWEDVVAIGERLPEVVAGTWWGTPGLLVGKKGFCRMRINPDAVVIKVADLDDKEALLRGDPDTYFTTPHYEGSAHVLVQLDAIAQDELADLIEDAWRLTAPRGSGRRIRPDPVGNYAGEECSSGRSCTRT